MRPYLENFIQTLSRRRQERVGTLLEDARVAKEQLEILLQRLEEFESLPLVLAKDLSDGRIRSSIIRSNVDTIGLRVEELYEQANIISLLLNGHASVLGSEVKSLEKELLAMEKMADEFAFLLSDNQAYDFAYLEAFTDEEGRDPDLVFVPDRSGLPFGPADHAHVRIDEEVLTLPDTQHESYGITGDILGGNALASVVTETDLDNVYTETSSTGWRMVVAVPGPVRAPLAGQDRDGVQVLLEFSLTQPSPCSEVLLVPYADMPLEVLRVTIFPDEDDEKHQDILTEPLTLDRPLTIHFPMETVLRFRVILNQSTFHRMTKFDNEPERRYGAVLRDVNKSRQVLRNRKSHVTQAERRIQSRISRDNRSNSLPSTNFRRGDVNRQVMFQRPDLWRNLSKNKSFIISRILRQMDTDLNKIQRRGGDFEIMKSSHILATDDPVPQIFSNNDHLSRPKGFHYFYNLGLTRISIGKSTPGFKGVFVSRPFGSLGDVGELRIKTKESNHELAVTDRQSPVVTSVEYSVSNKSNPLDETDWHPVLPAGQSFVEAERIFIDEEGHGLFRFKALAEEEINIYRNGYQMRTDSVEFIPGIAGSVVGIKIHPNGFTPEDIFTCSYLPVGDPTIFAFGEFNNPPLVFAHDDTGAGEGFLSTTANRNTVALSFIPYINPQEAQEEGFQPIVVQLDTGEVAQNITDYKTRRPVSFPEDNGYYYIHTGNRLMFNRPILEPFRVFYQYLQNNARIRIVLRSNTRNFVSPEVHYVHVKAKTRQPDLV